MDYAPESDNVFWINHIVDDLNKASKGSYYYSNHNYTNFCGVAKLTEYDKHYNLHQSTLYLERYCNLLYYHGTSMKFNKKMDKNTYVTATIFIALLIYRNKI